MPSDCESCIAVCPYRKVVDAATNVLEENVGGIFEEDFRVRRIGELTLYTVVLNTQHPGCKGPTLSEPDACVRRGSINDIMGLITKNTPSGINYPQFNASEGEEQ